MAQASLESRHLETLEKKDGDTESCPGDNQRRCEDGSCMLRTELCPEEELLSQETILVMIGVAMAIFLLLIFLYCIQQRRSSSEQQGTSVEEPNHPELLLTPPPAYDEAVDVLLYPPTPQIEHVLSTSEEPTTPPPNYDAALHILAQSEENLLVSQELMPEPPNLRRAVSADFLGINRCRPMTFSSFGANSKTFRKNAPPRDSPA
ncbi:uncharacterized protein LOC143285695 [Babylonia areolata]|uniref:uncharacterized protein LOC143285695 n=1 Tax=Babylonia areolata TaxID=304850 RepID=UPI003FD376B3